MKLEVHQKASENFNLKINELRHQLRFKYEPKKIKISHNPNVHISARISQTDIKGEIEQHWRDANGKISARGFYVRRKLIGLFDEDYRNLNRVAEGIQKSTNPKNVISVDLISELIFEWMKQKYKGIALPSMTEFVLSECEKQVQDAEVWIPISHLHIEYPFVLGNITFKTITKSFMDELENSYKLGITNSDESLKLEHYLERKRSKIQNLAVATMRIKAEPKQAYNIVFEETERAMSILRFFSPTNLFPTKICYTAPIEKQHMDKEVYFVVKDGEVINESSELSDNSIEYWNLSNQDLDSYAKLGLGFLGNLLTKNDLNDFQQKLLETLFLYSKASLAKEVSDRLVYTLVALETIFLKNDNEPIQDNISLRMAYMHPVTLEERKAIVKNIKDVYALRSSFIHHGKQIKNEDLQVLKKFVYDTWITLTGLISLAAKGITKQQFFEELENRRIGG
jgi:hypothetical protein